MAYVPKELAFSDVKLGKELGRGTYGSVYTINGEELSQKLGIGECIGDCWGIKRTNRSDQNESTIREIATTVSMNHINIINLFAAGLEPNNTYFFVMPIAISDLSGMMKRGLDRHQKDAFAYQMLAGVDYYLRNGIVHYDLKPQNMLIYQDSDRQILKIADFGSSEFQGCSPYQNNYNLMTLWYRAPELLWEIPYRYKVDLWSVGCILYEIYTDRVLFPGDSMVGQVMLIMKELGNPKAYLPAYQKSSHFNTVPNWEPNPDRFIKPEIPSVMSEIIRNLVVYDPDQRWKIHSILGDKEDTVQFFSQVSKEFPESFSPRDQKFCEQVFEEQDFKISQRLSPDITNNMIEILIDWLEEIRDTYDQPDKVFYAACYYVYKYLSIKNSLLRADLQLLGIACFYLASIYYNYIKSIDVSDLIYISSYTYTTARFEEMMKEVLFTLGFDLLVTTPDDYIYVENARNSPNANMFSQTLKLYMLPETFIGKSMRELYDLAATNTRNLPKVQNSLESLNAIRKKYNP